MYDICDIHSHVLPSMDDGCRTVQESVAVLKRAQSQGVSKLIITPHYYHKRESASDFIARRDVSEQQLRQALSQENGVMPQFCCGAEVAYFTGIDQYDDLGLLCLGRSRYLLLELPFTAWNGQVVRDVQNVAVRGFVPVLAHFERYVPLQSRQSIQRLLELEPLIQMNAESLLGFWKGACGRKALALGRVDLLGSDCHGADHRTFELGRAVAYLERRKMHSSLASVEALSNEIFAQALG